MIAPDTTALILLAAGKSARFGLSDKLTEDFLGHPLGMHVVTALEAIPFARRIAVGDGVKLGYAARGYDVIDNDRPEDGLSRSVRLGVEAARALGIEAVLIVLADMPRVTAAQILRLFDAQSGQRSIVASSDGQRPKPPALFGLEHFDALEKLTGDEGARDLLRAGHHVVTDPDELVDVDTVGDLNELLTKFGQAARSPA